MFVGKRCPPTQVNVQTVDQLQMLNEIHSSHSGCGLVGSAVILSGYIMLIKWNKKGFYLGCVELI